MSDPAATTTEVATADAEAEGGGEQSAPPRPPPAALRRSRRLLPVVALEQLEGSGERPPQPPHSTSSGSNNNNNSHTHSDDDDDDDAVPDAGRAHTATTTSTPQPRHTPNTAANHRSVSSRHATQPNFASVACDPQRGVLEAVGVLQKKPVRHHDTYTSALSSGWKVRHFWTSANPAHVPNPDANDTVNIRDAVCTQRSLYYFASATELKAAKKAHHDRFSIEAEVDGAERQTTHSGKKGGGKGPVQPQSASASSESQSPGVYKHLPLTVFCNAWQVAPLVPGAAVSAGNGDTDSDEVPEDGTAAAASDGPQRAPQSSRPHAEEEHQVYFDLRMCVNPKKISELLLQGFRNESVSASASTARGVDAKTRTKTKSTGIAMNPQQLHTLMREHKLVRTRSWRGRSIPNCFVASDAVVWLIQRQHLQDLDDDDDDDDNEPAQVQANGSHSVSDAPARGDGGPDLPPGSNDTKTQRARTLLEQLLLLGCIQAVSGPAWSRRMLHGQVLYSWNIKHPWVCGSGVPARTLETQAARAADGCFAAAEWAADQLIAAAMPFRHTTVEKHLVDAGLHGSSPPPDVAAAAELSESSETVSTSPATPADSVSNSAQRPCVDGITMASECFVTRKFRSPTEFAAGRWLKHLCAQVLCMAPFDVVPELGHILCNDQNYQRESQHVQEQVDEISLLLGVSTSEASSEQEHFGLHEVIHAELNCLRRDRAWNQYRLDVLFNQLQHVAVETAWLRRLSRSWLGAPDLDQVYSSRDDPDLREGGRLSSGDVALDSIFDQRHALLEELIELQAAMHSCVAEFCKQEIATIRTVAQLGKIDLEDPNQSVASSLLGPMQKKGQMFFKTRYFRLGTDVALTKLFLTYAYSKTNAPKKVFQIGHRTKFVDAAPDRPSRTLFNMVNGRGEVCLQMKAQSVKEKMEWIKHLNSIVDLVKSNRRFANASPSTDNSERDESIAVRRFMATDEAFKRLKASYADAFARWSSLRVELFRVIHPRLVVPTLRSSVGAVRQVVIGSDKLSNDDLDVFAANSASAIVAADDNQGAAASDDAATNVRAKLHVPAHLVDLWKHVGDARLPAGSVLWSWAWHLPTIRTAPDIVVPPDAVMAFIDHYTLTTAKQAGLEIGDGSPAPGVSTTVQVPDEAVDVMALALEKLVFRAASRYFFRYREHDLGQSTRRWQQQLPWLSTLSASDFGIDLAFQPTSDVAAEQTSAQTCDLAYDLPIRLCRLLASVVAPVDTINIIIQAIATTERVAGQLSAQRQTDAAAGAGGDVDGDGACAVRLSAEELFPIIAFVLARAAVPNFPAVLARALVFLLDNGSPRIGGGRAHYCLITMNGAYQWLFALEPVAHEESAAEGDNSANKKFVVGEGPERKALEKQLAPMFDDASVDAHIQWLTKLFST